MSTLAIEHQRIVPPRPQLRLMPAEEHHAEPTAAPVPVVKPVVLIPTKGEYRDPTPLERARTAARASLCAVRELRLVVIGTRCMFIATNPARGEGCAARGTR